MMTKVKVTVKTRLTAFILACLMLVTVCFAACGTTPADINSEEDLKNVKIGVIDGSKSEALAQKYVENGCETVKFDSRNGIVEAFEAGEIDCTILDENLAKLLVKENDTLEIRGEALGEDTLTFSMPKSKKVYTIMLNKALAALKKDGTFDEIVNGYLSDPEYVYDFAEELDNSNGSFTISLDPGVYPYVFPADESHEIPRGIALALIDAICKYLGCDYTLLPVTSSSLASTLMMGLADFSVGSYDIPTKEAAGVEIVETDPILTYNHVIVVKK